MFCIIFYIAFQQKKEDKKRKNTVWLDLGCYYVAVEERGNKKMRMRTRAGRSMGQVGQVAPTGILDFFFLQ